jgi:hypothetical protein
MMLRTSFIVALIGFSLQLPLNAAAPSETEQIHKDGFEPGASDPLIIELSAEAIVDGVGDALISNGVPFAKGGLSTTAVLAVFADGTEVAIHVDSLATWPAGSVRSALIQFPWPRSDLPRTFQVHIGNPRTTIDLPVTPITWSLPEAVAFPSAVVLAGSGVAGPQMPLGAEAWMTDHDARQLSGYEALKGDVGWGPDARDDGYYSTTNSWYHLFVRSGSVDIFRHARLEAVHYRDDQIIQEGADAGTMNGRSEPRYLYLKAMEVDYLLSGDPKTLEVAELMAAYLLSNWDPGFFFYATDDEHFWTERRAGFALLGLIVYGRMSGDATYLNATHARIDQLLATQAEWPDGGFIHNLYAHDPDECSDVGTYGGSPFMTGLLFEALIAYWEQFGDERIPMSVTSAVDWLWEDGWLGDSFQYQIGCEDHTAYGAVDLNLLIAHGFAFAAHHSEEAFRDQRAFDVFNAGVAEAYLGSRKHYNQNYRNSGAFLWYMTH